MTYPTLNEMADRAQAHADGYYGGSPTVDAYLERYGVTMPYGVAVEVARAHSAGMHEMLEFGLTSDWQTWVGVVHFFEMLGY